MITPIGRKYKHKRADRVVTVVDYEGDDWGGIWITYKDIDNDKDDNHILNEIPIDVFRDRFIRLDNYTKDKLKLNV